MHRYLQYGIVVFVASFSSSIFANELNLRPTQNYFYVGGTLGIASLVDKESTDNPIQDEHRLSAAGAMAGALAGYNIKFCNQWQLGLEAFINATSLSLSDNQNYAPQTSYTVKMRYNTGVRILPGYEFTPGTEGHFILGYAYGNFNINDNGNYGIINKSFSKNGFQTGLGVGTALTKCLSIRLDSLYTIYSSQTSNGITTSTPSASQIYHNRLSTLEGDVSLIYNV